jgi:hypothetical protein
MDAFDAIALEPSDVRDIYKANPKKDAFDQLEYEESWGKSLLRTLYQIPSGIAQGVTYPLDLISMVGTGEALDEEEIEHLKRISAREGIPFDEAKYYEAVQGASEAFPTQGNIENLIEQKTGVPLAPKTKLQKGLKLAATAGKLNPGSLSQKTTAAATAPTVSYALQKTGVPEGLSDFAGLAVSPGAAAITPKASIEAAKKPSGLTTRRFESIEKPKEISKSRYNKINEKLESDFRNIADKIIEDSPVSKTYTSLKEDSAFKSKIGDLFEKVEDLAEDIPNKFSSNIVKKEVAKKYQSKEGMGISTSEYDDYYQKFMKKFMKDTPSKEITAKDLVGQYRKNNRALGELYEPSKSGAYNRAKKDALLDYNRVISDVIETGFPQTEFSDLFKFTNKRWGEIKDSESINKFLKDMFDGKVRFDKGQKFFSKDRVSDSFKRALGEENFPKFEQLMKDLMSTQEAYKLLKKAESKGFSDFAKTGFAYLLHPNLAKAKMGLEYVQKTYNTLLDKPKLVFTWDEGIKSAKKGNFEEAINKFNLIEKEVKKQD